MNKVKTKEIVSVLEPILDEVRKMNLIEAQCYVTNLIQNSRINRDDKRKIITNVNSSNMLRVDPIYIEDKNSLTSYLVNSILKYKGHGVINI